MKVRLLRSALEDLISVRGYSGLQTRGFVDSFFDSLASEIDSLNLHAGIHGLQFSFYRPLASRFPYAIYYRLISGEVVVFRVLDFRRVPRWIRDIPTDNRGPSLP